MKTLNEIKEYFVNVFKDTKVANGDITEGIVLEMWNGLEPKIREILEEIRLEEVDSGAGADLNLQALLTTEVSIPTHKVAQISYFYEEKGFNGAVGIVNDKIDRVLGDK